MKFTKFLLAAALMISGIAAHAQSEQAEFNHHWFLQLQGGANYNLDKAKFSKLLSPAAQIAVGYQFTPVWGLRLAANGWQAKGGFSNDETYKWKYIAPALDVRFNLMNAIAGYNPNRVFSMNLMLGAGANIGWDNDNNFGTYGQYAINQNDKYFWDGTKVRFLGRGGLDFDFKLSKCVSVNLEAMANALSDHYNSRADNKHDIDLDWYFSGLVGLKIALSNPEKVIPVAIPVVVEEPAAPVQREQPKPQPAVTRAPEMQTEIFYYIRQTVIRDDQKGKLNNLISFLKQNPETKVAVTGYADVETGNPRINMMYSQGRAEGVAKALTEAGIDAARITVDAKGDTVQPFSENDKNRVSICIAK